MVNFSVYQLEGREIVPITILAMPSTLDRSFLNDVEIDCVCATSTFIMSLGFAILFGDRLCLLANCSSSYSSSASGNKTFHHWRP